MPSTHYDDKLQQIPGLTWLPWVGRHFHKHAPGQRLLIVGESHYSNESDPVKMPTSLRNVSSLITYTREVVQECPIDQDWRNRTLENIQRFLIGDDAADRARLWGEFSFYNFVQRPMEYTRRERPSWDDWVAAWPVFVDVVRVLRPSHCIFVGVQAAHSFNYSMAQAGVPFTPVKLEPKVGSAYPRTANVTVDGRELPILFLKHAGSYFSWEDWYEFVRGKYGKIVELLQRGQQPQSETDSPALPG